MTHANETIPSISRDCPVTEPVEGSPIGNGRMGTLVWTTSGAVEMQINRVDVFAVNRHAAGPCFPGPTDYGGGCAKVTIDIGGEPFLASPAFRQSLSLADAMCTIDGEGVSIAFWVATTADVLIVSLTDRRDNPQAVEVTLSMWRASEVRHGDHVASYTFSVKDGRPAVRQTFREADHYCVSAVALQASGPSGEIDAAREDARVLRLPPARGTRHLLIASAAAMQDDRDPLDIALRTLDACTTSDAVQDLREQHAQWWHAFWDRTCVEITSPDGTGERAAQDRQLLLYHMASTSRGDYPPKWNGAIFLTTGDARDWGSQYWVWTTEMLYWSLPAADALDLCTPFFEMYRRQLPAAETAARQRWAARGAFFPETTPFDGAVDIPEALVPAFQAAFPHGTPSEDFPPELADRCRFEHHLTSLMYSPATLRFDNHGCSWISHLTSSGAEIAVFAWWRYRYTGDTAWLRSNAYPLLRGVAEFYRSYARRGEDGRWHIHRTNAHEDFWGVTDSIMDLAAIRGVVPLAIRAAKILGEDAVLSAEWQAFLDALAPYPLGSDPRARALTGGTLADDAWAAGYLGAVDGSRNAEDVQLTPIFPFEDWTRETADLALETVARRTLALAPRHQRVLAGEALPTAIRSPIAAMRGGDGEALPTILARYRAAFTPRDNGFSLFEQGTPGAQAHSIEHLGLLTLTLQEALLQSVSSRPGEPEIISVFPAWPRAWNASFRLLARGGFLVSATIRAGVVQRIEITSRLGEACRVRNPWPEAADVTIQSHAVCQHVSGKIFRFTTEPGGVYDLIPVIA